MPRGIPKQKELYGKANFIALEKAYEEALTTINDLKLNNSEYEQYLKTKVTSRDFENSDLTEHQQGLMVALVTCGNRILNLERNLSSTRTDLESQYQSNMHTYENCAKMEASGTKEEPSNPPIQPTNPATIKSKPETTEAKKKTIRRKK